MKPTDIWKNLEHVNRIWIFRTDVASAKKKNYAIS